MSIEHVQLNRLGGPTGPGLDDTRLPPLPPPAMRCSSAATDAGDGVFMGDVTWVRAGGDGGACCCWVESGAVPTRLNRHAATSAETTPPAEGEDARATGGDDAGVCGWCVAWSSVTLMSASVRRSISNSNPEARSQWPRRDDEGADRPAVHASVGTVSVRACVAGCVGVCGWCLLRAEFELAAKERGRARFKKRASDRKPTKGQRARTHRRTRN